jgi:hypothetical protein
MMLCEYGALVWCVLGCGGLRVAQVMWCDVVWIGCVGLVCVGVLHPSDRC